jgi:hypothetical protein
MLSDDNLHAGGAYEFNDRMIFALSSFVRALM